MKILTRIIIVLLLLTNIATAVRLWWMDLQWRTEVFGVSTYAGSLEADGDFNHGVLRLYELSTTGHRCSTGRHKGPYEIWRWPDFGGTNHHTADQFVQSYNRRMTYMHDHPDEFRDETRPSETKEGK